MIGLFTLYALAPNPLVPGKHQRIDLVVTDVSENRTSPCWLG